MKKTSRRRSRRKKILRFGTAELKKYTDFVKNEIKVGQKDVL